MMRVPALFKRLRDSCDGAFAVETAIVAPVLLLMSLGAFQISMVIARHTELQSAMAEAESIALATDPDTAAKRTVLQNVIVASTGLSADKVTVSEAYRCDNSDVYVTAATGCVTGTIISSYIKIRMTDTYTPRWTQFGLGSPITYDQTRYVMYKQATKT